MGSQGRSQRAHEHCFRDPANLLSFRGLKAAGGILSILAWMAGREEACSPATLCHKRFGYLGSAAEMVGKAAQHSGYCICHEERAAGYADTFGDEGPLTALLSYYVRNMQLCHLGSKTLFPAWGQLRVPTENIQCKFLIQWEAGA